MAQKPPGTNTEGTFGSIEAQIVPSQDIKNLQEIGNMVFFSETFDKHIIDINLYSLPYQRPKHFGDHSLIGCSCVLQTERHHPIAICSPGCDKSCLFLVGRVHWNLMIALEGIQET